MTIKLRLITSAVIGVLTALFLGAGSIVVISILGQTLNESAVAIKSLRHSMQADMMHDALRADVFRAVLAAETGNPADYASAQTELAEHGDEFRLQLQALQGLTLNAVIQKNVNDVVPVLDDYVAAAHRIADLAGTDVIAAKNQLPKFQQEFAALVEPMEALGSAIEDYGREVETAGTAHLTGSRVAMLVATLIGIALSIATARNLLRAILRPLRKAVTISQAVSRGDLESNIDVERNDEMGNLLEAMKHMQITLRKLILGVKDTVEAAEKGDFSKRVNDTSFEGSQLDLVSNVNKLMHTAEAGMKDVSVVLGAIAEGDLARRVANDYEGLLGKLRDDANKTGAHLADIVDRIKNSATTILDASRDVTSGNNELFRRTQEQASSLEETATAMEELSSTVKQNAENAHQANQLAIGASDVAVKGGEVVKQVVQTMGGISDSSKKIADIIGVIDGIAFQTNILALNAAVEAARAGEQGRGFAVVATEVRNLAQRSAAAAKEIKELITDSVSKVDTGSHLVDQAGKTMQEIVTSVKRVTDIMSEITTASQEQSIGIDQVSTAVGQMDQITQSNAALMEEAVAAAESFEDQAKLMSQIVARFRLAQSSSGTHDVTTASASVERRGPGRANNVQRLPEKGVRAGQRVVNSSAGDKPSANAGEWVSF